MRTAACIAFAITMLAAMSANAVGVKQSTTTGSFLRYRANSAGELASMVKRDPAVASRYAKHFGTTGYGVSAFFEKKLSLIRLRKPTTSYVYYYNSRGQVTRGRRVMPAGTLVFATALGEPVLDWRCGNPLRTNLPVSRAIRPDDAPRSARGGAAAIKPTKMAAAPPDADKVIEKVLGVPPAELTSTATTTPATIATAPLETITVGPMATAPTLSATGAAAPPIVEVAAIPAIATVSAAPALAAASHSLASWLLPLAAAGGAAVSLSGKSSNPEPPPDDKVPEPGSLLAITTGCSALVTSISGMRRRASRRR